MKIMVSACLAGENCKYNGGNNRNEKILQLMAENEVVKVCPEQMGGLPTPRVPAEIRDGVVTAKDGRIVDAEFRAGAAKCLETAVKEQPDLIILQSRSPSCGVKERYDGSFSGKLTKGAGVTAQQLMENGFRVIDVEDLIEIYRGILIRKLDSGETVQCGETEPGSGEPKLRRDETELLKEFLYEAIFIPEGIQPPERSIIELPELAIYYENFGKGLADNCLVAEDDGKVVGAVWTRIMNDYGHVDDDTPSFAISLYKEYRGKGIGTELMRRMLGLLKEQGYKKASLAVQKANYAVRMYAAVGFRTVDENAEEYIMVRDLQIPG